jgi:DNA invertase Pin-like site-specific DNA recombinase
MSTRRRDGLSYSRFSDPYKQSKGDSQDRQDRTFRDFCTRHTLTPLPEFFADKGRSGYKDEHRKKGRFGDLVAQAKDGKFEPGTVVVVEAWDRLGRLRPDKQVDLIAELLRTGVDIGIARLDDIFTESDFGTHKWTSLAVFVQLAYQESKQKAERIAASWEKRRELARAENKQMSKRLPGWLDAQRKPIPERVAVLKRIFKLSADGYGRARIVRTLTKEGVKTFSDKGDKWTRPYVNKLLTDRRVLGELQPRREDGTPDGPVIPDYYPRVISEEEYLLARAGQEGRRGKGGSRKGPRDRKYVNVFQSLLRHARDGESFYLHNRGTGAKPLLVLTSGAGMSGRTARTYTFPYPILEEAVLSLLPEIDPRDVLPREKDTPSKADVLRAQLEAVRRDIAGLEDDLRGGHSKRLSALLREKEAEEERVAGQLQDELSRTVKPVARAWQELPTLAKLVKDGGDPARLKLRPVLRRVIEEAWLLTVARGGSRLAALQFFFHGGARREFLVLYSPAGYNRPMRWRAWSLTDSPLPTFDLRDRGQAKALVEELAGYNLSWLTG